MSGFQNENELVSAAAAGDKDAMSQLIASVMPAVEVAASQNAGDGTITRSDLIQEGLIGAINAIFTFDISKGVRFSTYAQRCISNRISSVVRDSRREKRQSNTDYVSLEDVDFSLTSGKDNPESVVSMAENVEAVQTCISEKLTELERQVILLHIAENSYEKIAEKLGITTKAVGNALARARQKIRAEID